MAVADGPCILALDQGTTNTKAVLVRAASGAIVASGSCPLPIHHPAPGWVEQDAHDVWMSVLTAVEACLADHDEQIAAIGISNQRESVVAWDERTGEALGPVIGWQDARTADRCEALREHGAVVAAISGLPLDAMYSAPKMRWLLDAVGEHPHARIGTIDTYLVHRLTGELHAEAGNASRTMLLDLDELQWSERLADVFGVPLGALAPVCRSDGGFGVTRGAGAVPAGIPVAAVMADSHAALYLHSGGRPGEGKVTYGTGSSIMIGAERDRRTAPGIATTLAWLQSTPQFAVEGNILASGAALAWMAQLLTGGDLTALGALAEATNDDEVTFVPAFSGLGAPYFDRGARAQLSGMGAGTGAREIANAAFSAVAHQVADVVEAMGAAPAAGGDASAVVHADGGATASSLLMQRQADLLGIAIHVSEVAEASALGAALMAARAVGLVDPDASWRLPSHAVTPEMNPAERARQRARWSHAIAQSRQTYLRDRKDHP